ncbi:MAG: bifunctional folylpolyglutamate synthase/dihydrofolate synthase [Planctomycetaceae bacterium]|nr:bifunctional folylpolyglutamate synthase/dihydrofolate synthase [Planctomycetaceae bacterium]
MINDLKNRFPAIFLHLFRFLMTQDPQTPQYREAIAFLADRENHERTPVHNARTFQLASMRQLLARLGDPQNLLCAIHIAGTKGKGSTAAMLAAVGTASGYRVGLYTSPHLDCVEERFVVDGASIDSHTLAELLLEMKPIAEEMDQHPDRIGPTYFEIVTALAMLYFVRQKVDFCVLEVGMGGRLDSTNVCRPEVTVITSVSLDHTRELGDTVSQIAHEKAGIIKQGIPVVSGVTDAAARHVIAEKAESCKAPLFEVGRDFKAANYAVAPGNRLQATFDFKGHCKPLKTREAMPLGLLGRHQAENAALALAVLDLLSIQNWVWDDLIVRQTLAGVCCRGRVEVISRDPDLVIDAAHNVASIGALLEALDEIDFGPSRVLVFASSLDKDLLGMLKRLVPKFRHVILTKYPGSSRAADPKHLGKIVQQVNVELAQGKTSFEVQRDPVAAWRVACDRLAQGQSVCVTGSFFIAAHLRRMAAETGVPTEGRQQPLPKPVPLKG